MLIDAGAVPRGQLIETDVCIVGSGPAGIVLGLELMGSGLTMCILESGARAPDRRRNPPAGGTSVGYPYYPLKSATVRAFGGSSRHWGSGNGDFWHACPLDDLDFEERPGIPHSGWPFSRANLVPFYRRAEAVCELEPFEYSPPQEGARESRPLGDGRVVRGSLQIARSTFDRHLDRFAASDNVQLILNGHAATLARAASGDEIGSVRVLSRPANEFSVHAGAYILAAGGIENARLMLLSRLGNENGVVGRYFMEHIGVRSGAVVPADPRLLESSGLYSPRDSEGGLRTTLRLEEALLRDEGLLSTAFLVEPRPRAFVSDGVRSATTLYRSLSYRPSPGHLLRHVGAVISDVGDVSRTVRQTVARRPARNEVLVFWTQAEQAPNPDSRITLGNDRDEFGLPRPRLDWRFAGLDRRSIRRTQDIVDRALRLAQLGRLENKLGDERPPALVRGLFHHLGTTRMHTDPGQGVVDADCRVHGIANLFVTGGSVFPTGGWANPTLTVVALAMRLADHIKSRLRAV